MIIDGNKLVFEDTVLTFDSEVMEAGRVDERVIVVLDTQDDNGFDNVYCYGLNNEVRWRIKPVPVEIGGTARTPYVGVDVDDNLHCKLIDFFGRRFTVDICTGDILGMDIVK